MNNLLDYLQVLYLSIKYWISGDDWERAKKVARDIVYGWE